MAERFAFCGLASNLLTYLTDELHEPTSTAVKIVNTWVGVSYLFPVLGAFTADSFLGRFRTILVASIIYCMVYIYKLLNLSYPMHTAFFFFLFHHHQHTLARKLISITCKLKATPDYNDDIFRTYSIADVDWLETLNALSNFARSFSCVSMLIGYGGTDLKKRHGI